MKFDKTLLPDEIVTLEQLAGWVIAELSSRSVSVRYREIENRIPERVEKFGPIFFYLNLPEAAPCLGYRVRCHPVSIPFEEIG